MSDFRQKSALPFFEKATKRALGRVKSIYLDLRGDPKTRRVLGFKCDLKKCDSTLAQCSARSCKKKSMVFDSSVSDTSTASSTSGKDR